ncbi:MAG: undecaprenyl-diphosphate phosphatase [Desulfobacterota bacterium]|nr:undecaprenyl-diphosphate phosphatase [Thermodesulfobacteriota bacterium]
MTFFEAAFLGIVQGLTEFFPISSSGHLVFFQSLFGMKEPHLFFDVMVHFGTLLAVVLYFRNDLQILLVQTGSALLKKRKGGPGTRLFALIAVATLPTGLMGVLLKDRIEPLFIQPKWAAGMLLITGAMLFLTRWFQNGKKGATEMRWVDAVLIGTAQGIALLPGISRSGATIAAGLFLGLNREWAGRFSFLLSIPAILGATVLELREVNSFAEFQAASVAAGIAFLTGLLALAFLMRVIRFGKLSLFSYYCWGIGGTTIILS